MLVLPAGSGLGTGVTARMVVVPRGSAGTHSQDAHALSEFREHMRWPCAAVQRGAMAIEKSGTAGAALCQGHCALGFHRELAQRVHGVAQSLQARHHGVSGVHRPFSQLRF